MTPRESFLFAKPPAGNETILIAEDHENLRHYTTTILAELGYTILEAARWPAALRVPDAQDIDLLFTDVVLPGDMTGRELADHARIPDRPDLRVLFTTGYIKNAILHNGRLDA